ncbi:hypothetical protein [Methylophilus sp. Leaf414]|uniref:hypothetical protein n=1 Tax=Methylophilus sp. Leaf414 TaxID=1736371 RepID=UPI000A830A99|nr:hypothetical protein [Methylophilus sp. Leaf414]
MNAFIADDIEFSFSFTHAGIEVTLTAKLLAGVSASFVDSVSDRESCLREAAAVVLPQVIASGHEQLMKFHHSIEQSLGIALASALQSRVAP